ncbi:MAG: hypothetical protein FJ100_02825 [Deltaproteobacteria bacterium]|nr:hypothetical protein [Deltaproteobacteria bacterium]
MSLGRSTTARSASAAIRWAVAALCTATRCASPQTADPDPTAAEPANAAEPARSTGAGARKGGGARRVDPRADPWAGALVIPRPRLDRVLAAGPGWLLGQVPLEPLRDGNKKFLGYRIVSLFGDDPQVLRYGVLPGDRLVSVQGHKIVVPTDLLQVFQKLKTDRVLQVKVVRAGQERSFAWPVLMPGEPLPGVELAAPVTRSGAPAEVERDPATP